MFGYGEKIAVVEDQKEKKLAVATIVGDEKKKEILLMGLTKRKQ